MKGKNGLDCLEVNQRLSKIYTQNILNIKIKIKK